jgi:hypothetical protein
MGKWETLAQKTYSDIEKLKAKNKKQAENDCTAVIVNNIFRIKKRMGRG